MVPRFPLALFLLLTFPALASIQSSVERELTPRELDMPASVQSFARVASNGSEFLAVWTEGQFSETDILAARLAPSGAVLDRVPLVIANTSARENLPTVEWGGDRYLAVWSSGSDRVLGRFILNDGSLSDVFQIATRGNQFLTQRLEVAFNGRVFLVAWHDGAAFHGTIVDRAGRVGPTRELARGSLFDLVVMRDAFYFVTLNDLKTFVVLQLDEDVRIRSQFDVASTTQYVTTLRAEARGDELLFAWQSGDRIHITRVTAAGVQEQSFLDLESQTLEGLIADDAGYVLIYGNFRGSRWRRLGDVSDSPVPVPPVGSPSVYTAGSNGARTIVLVHTNGIYDTFAEDLYVSILGEDVVLPLVIAPRQQTVPDAAAAGDVTLVVWREMIPSEARVILAGRRIDAHGTPLGDAFEIGSDIAARPRVASNGSDWLVVWENRSFPTKLLGRRLRRDGSFVDAAPLVLDEPVVAGHSAVAWDGASYVVAFSRGLPSRFPNFQIHALRVPASGGPAAHVDITITGNHLSPAIASGSNGSLLVWNEGEKLRGALLSQSGTVTPLAFPAAFGRAPSVAWNGDSFLVATGELRWLRVDASGNVSEPPFTFRVGAAIAPPRVEPFGDGFLLYWIQDQQLFAAMLQRDGTPLEAATVIAPSVHSFGAAGPQLVIAHTIDHPTKPVRVFVQTIERSQPIVRRRAVGF